MMWGELTFKTWFESSGVAGDVRAAVTCDQVPSATCYGPSLKEALESMADLLAGEMFEEHLGPQKQTGGE